MLRTSTLYVGEIIILLYYLDWQYVLEHAIKQITSKLLELYRQILLKKLL